MNRRCHHGIGSGSPRRTMSALTTARLAPGETRFRAIAEPNLGGRATVEIDGLFDPDRDHHPGSRCVVIPTDQPGLRPSTTTTTICKPSRRASVHPPISPTAVRGSRTQVSGPHVRGHVLPSCKGPAHLRTPRRRRSRARPPGVQRGTGRSRRLVVVCPRGPSPHRLRHMDPIMPTVSSTPAQDSALWFTGCAGPFPAARSPLTASSARSRDATSRSVA